MSRSYRRPYAAITGTKSAKQDKLIARRAVRRMENQRIRNCQDFEMLMMPDRLDCAFNDTWSWGRDGKQFLHFPPEPLKTNSEFDVWWFEYQTRYYARLLRK